ncbi:MAG: hypothetical protein RJA70_4160 [Pseudomonadota bacterium]|jgi:tRNA pseudouridine65 synthase
MSLQVLYRDSSLLVVNKPSGLAVHRGWARDKTTLLTEARRVAGQHVYPCHRLDRGTSGVFLFALSAELATQIQAGWTAREVLKTYLAWVRGHAPALGHLDYPLAKDKLSERRTSQTSLKRLQTAEFENVELPRYPRRYSLILAMPHTGRLHQVRKHLRHLSHPLVGDIRYGKKEHNLLCAERFGLRRLALHASHLSIVHPIEMTRLTWTAPLPPDLDEPFERIGFQGAALQAIAAPIWQPELSAPLPQL